MNPHLKGLGTQLAEVLADILQEKKAFTIQKLTQEEECINKKVLRLNWQKYVTLQELRELTPHFPWWEPAAGAGPVLTDCRSVKYFARLPVMFSSW